MTTPPGPDTARSRLRISDILRLALRGLRGRPTRTALSALGVAIGIAAVVSVYGVSASSQAALLAQIDALGTNLLTAAPGQSLLDGQTQLPTTAPAMIARIPQVGQVAYTGSVGGHIYRNSDIPATENNDLTILAASTSLPATLDIPVVSGTWLNNATARYPTAVLGATAARRLGITLVTGTPPTVYLAGQWFTVIGVLGPATLSPDIDTSVLVGFPEAHASLDFDGHPTTVYERSTDDAVQRVRSLLPATANPAHPEQVDVSRPSDALIARTTAQRTFSSLYLGLGAIALLVGGIGIANVMVISVLERRAEIGLQRALGATRHHIRVQFLTESLLLTLLGGATGLLAGTVLTLAWATDQGWAAHLPAQALLAATAATMLIGTVAGLYPAHRAAQQPPTQALLAL